MDPIGMLAVGDLVASCYCRRCGHHASIDSKRLTGGRLRCSQCWSTDCYVRRVWIGGKAPDNVRPIKR